MTGRKSLDKLYGNHADPRSKLNALSVIQAKNCGLGRIAATNMIIMPSHDERD